VKEKSSDYFKDPFVCIKAFMVKEHKIFLRSGVMFFDGLALAELNETPRLKMSDIAEKTFSTRPATTFCVNRLIMNGLVKRYRSQEDDRRVVWVKITPKGKRLFKSIQKKWELFRGDISAGKFRENGNPFVCFSPVNDSYGV